MDTGGEYHQRVTGNSNGHFAGVDKMAVCRYFMVGVARFELATPSPPDSRACHRGLGLPETCCDRLSLTFRVSLGFVTNRDTGLDRLSQ